MVVVALRCLLHRDTHNAGVRKDRLHCRLDGVAVLGLAVVPPPHDCVAHRCSTTFNTVGDITTNRMDEMDDDRHGLEMML